MITSAPYNVEVSVASRVSGEKFAVGCLIPGAINMCIIVLFVIVLN